MAERVWDRFLTEPDRADTGAAFHTNPGTRPVLVLIGFSRWGYGHLQGLGADVLAHIAGTGAARRSAAGASGTAG